MGHSRKVAALIAGLLFAGAAYLVHTYQQAGIVVKSSNLSSALSTIPGWRFAGNIPLDAPIITELALDDYIYQRFQKENHLVTLYIGYYLKHAQIGAAHDPLVCFPGQGWVLSERERGDLQLPQVKRKLDYAIMSASRGVAKERVLYWFQAVDVAVATTFEQKIAAFVSKIEGKGGESAFVRITCSVNKANEDCDTALRDFAASFYPLFHQFVLNSRSPSAQLDSRGQSSSGRLLSHHVDD